MFNDKIYRNFKQSAFQSNSYYERQERFSDLKQTLAINEIIKCGKQILGSIGIDVDRDEQIQQEITNYQQNGGPNEKFNLQTTGKYISDSKYHGEDKYHRDDKYDRSGKSKYIYEHDYNNHSYNNPQASLNSKRNDYSFASNHQAHQKNKSYQKQQQRNQENDDAEISFTLSSNQYNQDINPTQYPPKYQKEAYFNKSYQNLLKLQATKNHKIDSSLQAIQMESPISKKASLLRKTFQPTVSSKTKSNQIYFATPPTILKRKSIFQERHSSKKKSQTESRNKNHNYKNLDNSNQNNNYKNLDNLRQNASETANKKNKLYTPQRIRSKRGLNIPLSQKIIKNVYGKIKQQTKIHSFIASYEQEERFKRESSPERWNNFIERSQRWLQQKNSHILQHQIQQSIQFAGQANISPKQRMEKQFIMSNSYIIKIPQNASFNTRKSRSNLKKDDQYKVVRSGNDQSMGKSTFKLLGLSAGNGYRPDNTNKRINFDESKNGGEKLIERKRFQQNLKEQQQRSKQRSYSRSSSVQNCINKLKVQTELLKIKLLNPMNNELNARNQDQNSKYGRLNMNSMNNANSMSHISNANNVRNIINPYNNSNLSSNNSIKRFQARNQRQRQAAQQVNAKIRQNY